MEDIMAGGKRIDDRSSWMGPAEKGEVFPKGVKTKMETSANGAGELSVYEDTTQAIKGQQEMGEKKVKAHSLKAGHRQ